MEGPQGRPRAVCRNGDTETLGEAEQQAIEDGDAEEGNEDTVEDKPENGDPPGSSAA
jgi:hypothetical protein